MKSTTRRTCNAFTKSNAKRTGKPWYAIGARGVACQDFLASAIRLWSSSSDASLSGLAPSAATLRWPR